MSGTLGDYLKVVGSAPSGAPAGVVAPELALRLNTANNHLEAWDGAAWQDTTGSGGGGGALTSQSSALASDVTIAAANIYYDGPTISLVAGTWLLVGAVNVVLASNPENFTGKLWDGTIVYAVGQIQTASAAAFGIISLAGIVVPTATTTYKISVATQSATTALIKAAAALNAAGNHNSYIYAVKIA